MLKDKNILLCISGGIAAYKMPNLASMLVKKGCNVNVIMTKSAENFITAKTFEALTGNPCFIDTFQTTYPISIHHIKLATEADYVMVAPATADIIGKIAHGIADDMLTSTLLACKCPVAIAPSMNVNMLENPIVQDNIKKLASIRPDTAIILKDGIESKVNAESVEIGTTIIVKPYARIPLDGVVTKGTTTIDNSALTGESLPVDIAEGDTVLSGGINGNNRFINSNIFKDVSYSFFDIRQQNQSGDHQYR